MAKSRCKDELAITRAALAGLLGIIHGRTAQHLYRLFLDPTRSSPFPRLPLARGVHTTESPSREQVETTRGYEVTSGAKQ